jgi:GNAT superfamily N-acetyltransferase
MLEPAKYSALETLRDGWRIEIRALRPDEYQSHGIGAALLRHLAAIARNAGLEELIAEVLPDNLPMLKVFENSGFPMSRKHDFQAVHVSLRLR